MAIVFGDDGEETVVGKAFVGAVIDEGDGGSDAFDSGSLDFVADGFPGGLVAEVRSQDGTPRVSGSREGSTGPE